MSAKKKDLDPYEVLGIDFGATDAAISKAYRKLALKLHPDRLVGLSDSKLATAAERFQEIQQARSFLLDPENADERRKYDAKQASTAVRRQADAAREKSLSERRKRMRDDLNRQEEEARQGRKRKSSKGPDVESLRREGMGMREAHADRTAAADVESLKRKRQEEREKLEERQIRLKWSRKKLQISPSEHSLAALMARFGSVDRVEMLGSKGNSALVTFESPASCAPCVEAHQDSDEMRASYIGKRKENADAMDQGEEVKPMERQDTESVADWKRRQAVERERLLQQMQAEETGDSTFIPSQQDRRQRIPFPPEFPTPSDGSESPMESLVKAERSILKDLATMEQLQQLGLV